MKPSIFREYDIRGRIGSELLLDEVYPLIQAIITFLKNKNRKIKTILVGRDGRESSPHIYEQTIKAIIHAGLDVVAVNIVPSPVLYFGMHTLNVQAGLMITASHNPADYNGIKIMLGTHCVWGNDIGQIKTLYYEYKIDNGSDITEHGKISEYNLIAPYINYMVDQFAHLKNIRMPVVFDCGDAVASVVMPDLVTAFGWRNVQLLCTDITTPFAHHEADPTVEKNMLDVKVAVQTTDAQLGIGFDGDADRMAAMTKAGILVTGDKLLAIFAQQLAQTDPASSVVFNVTMSSGLIDLLNSWKLQPRMVPTGHAIVKEKMDEYKALLGGEGSCHFFFKDRYFGYDDGIYAALRLLEIIHQTKKSLDELITIFPIKYTSREYRIACADDKKREIVQNIEKILSECKTVELITIDGVRASWPYGWGIVRAANTQPALSVRFEADSPEKLQQIKKLFVDMLARFIDAPLLKELQEN